MKNLKYIPTTKLKEILSSPHCTGIDGKDYGPVKHELQDILWSRQSREIFIDHFEEYEQYLDPIGVPSLPEENIA